MASGVPVVVVDNTNISRWEARTYVESAILHGYRIVIVESSTPWARDAFECAHRNTHGVPAKSIQGMLRRWQRDYTIEDILMSSPPPKTPSVSSTDSTFSNTNSMISNSNMSNSNMMITYGNNSLPPTPTNYSISSSGNNNTNNSSNDTTGSPGMGNSITSSLTINHTLWSDTTNNNSNTPDIYTSNSVGGGGGGGGGSGQYPSMRRLAPNTRKHQLQQHHHQQQYQSTAPGSPLISHSNGFSPAGPWIKNSRTYYTISAQAPSSPSPSPSSSTTTTHIQQATLTPSNDSSNRQNKQTDISSLASSISPWQPSNNSHDNTSSSTNITAVSTTGHGDGDDGLVSMRDGNDDTMTFRASDGILLSHLHDKKKPSPGYPIGHHSSSSSLSSLAPTFRFSDNTHLMPQPMRQEGVKSQGKRRLLDAVLLQEDGEKARKEERERGASISKSGEYPLAVSRGSRVSHYEAQEGTLITNTTTTSILPSSAANLPDSPDVSINAPMTTTSPVSTATIDPLSHKSMNNPSAVTHDNHVVVDDSTATTTSFISASGPHPPRPPRSQLASSSAIQQQQQHQQQQPSPVLRPPHHQQYLMPPNSTSPASSPSSSSSASSLSGRSQYTREMDPQLQLKFQLLLQSIRNARASNMLRNARNTQNSATTPSPSPLTSLSPSLTTILSKPLSGPTQSMTGGLYHHPTTLHPSSGSSGPAAGRSSSLPLKHLGGDEATAEINSHQPDY